MKVSKLYELQALLTTDLALETSHAVLFPVNQCQTIFRLLPEGEKIQLSKKFWAKEETDPDGPEVHVLPALGSLVKRSTRVSA